MGEYTINIKKEDPNEIIMNKIDDAFMDLRAEIFNSLYKDRNSFNKIVIRVDKVIDKVNENKG